MKTEAEIQAKIRELQDIEFTSSNSRVRNSAHTMAKALCWAIEDENGNAVEKDVSQFIHNFSR